MIPDILKKLRIFVASPSDVASERAKVETVAATLKPMADYLGLALEVSDWRKVVPDMGRPQQVIFDQLQPTSWDVFIGILWHRFGTPPNAIDAQREKEYLAGTEEEFWTAYRLWQQFGRPRMLMYRCTRPVDLNTIDFDQAKRVKEFFGQFEAKGEHPGLTQSFDTSEAFEKLLFDHLQKTLIEYGEQVKTPITPEVVQIYAPRIPNNLPRRAAFFGRAKEMDVAMRALNPADRTWGILIDGIGGIGKTALAVEAAHHAQEAGLFDAFVFVTAKQNILDPSSIREITPAARTLDEFLNETVRVLGQPGIAKLTGNEKRRVLLDGLRMMRTLLVYDNLETLSKEEQEALADFLRELPQGCKAIITSRRRGGEGAVWLRVEAMDWDAAHGIIENETTRDSGLANKLHNVESRWQELYDETSGSPLALVHTLGLMRVRVTLTFDDALEMLRGNRDDDLQKFIFQEARKELTENDKTALGALSFFVPTATFEAWMQVANLSRNALETTIDRLSALSLVDLLAGEERYALHPLTRTFIRSELLVDAKVARETGMSFARYWVSYAAQYGSSSLRCAFCTLSNQWACSGRYGSNCSHKTYHQLDDEWTNLNIAVDWLWETRRTDSDSTTNQSSAKLLIDLVHSVSQFLWHSGSWDKRVELNDYGYQAAKSIKAWDDASWCADDVAWVYYLRGDLAASDLWARNCQDAATKSGSKNTMATATRICGLVAQQRKDYQQAQTLLNEALDTWRIAGNDTCTAIVLDHLGSLACERREFFEARQYYDEAFELAQKIKNEDIQAILSGNLGELALERDEWAEALSWFERQLPLAQEVGSVDLIAQAQFGRARVHETEGRADLTLPLAQEALKIYERLQHKDLAKVRELVERLKQRQEADG